MRLKVELNFHLRYFLLGLAIILLGVGCALLLYVKLANKNPLPKDIQQQVNFSTLYPKTSPQLTVDQNSLQYNRSQKSITFISQFNQTHIILTEQKASGDSTDPTLAYYESLGLHPVTQIQTKLGLVVIVNFYTAGTLSAVGQDAVLADNGTLLIAHPANQLEPEQWKSFFNSLKLYK